MNDVYILGIHATAVGRYLERGFGDLLHETYTGALADAGLEDGRDVGHVWFSNYMMDYWGQPYIRGQVCMRPVVEEGLLPAEVPTTNVEGGCASASIAFNGAWKEILAGQSPLALAIGVEKLYDPERPNEALEWLGQGTDLLHPEDWRRLYAKTAADIGGTFAPKTGQSIAMDVYALWAASHMDRYGTTAEQIACVAAKNHTNAVDNPRAQYRFGLTVDEVLADRMISEPLTRAMCAPMGDGAAAALLCSQRYLDDQPEHIRHRAIRVHGHAVAGGRFTAGWEDDRASVAAARRAFAMADLSPRDIDIVELHDATSFAEIHLLEDLGFCKRGQGGPYTAAGATAPGGELPVNLSGGLVSRGHPIGATGLMMLNELAVQLRGEAGASQRPNARLGLAENGGGLFGNDVAACAVTILEGRHE
jgi:acetyl-CoA acetyltransferase